MSWCRRGLLRLQSGRRSTVHRYRATHRDADDRKTGCPQCVCDCDDVERVVRPTVGPRQRPSAGPTASQIHGHETEARGPNAGADRSELLVGPGEPMQPRGKRSIRRTVLPRVDPPEPGRDLELHRHPCYRRSPGATGTPRRCDVTTDACRRPGARRYVASPTQRAPAGAPYLPADDPDTRLATASARRLVLPASETTFTTLEPLFDARNPPPMYGPPAAGVWGHLKAPAGLCAHDPYRCRPD